MEKKFLNWEEQAEKLRKDNGWNDESFDNSCKFLDSYLKTYSYSYIKYAIINPFKAIRKECLINTPEKLRVTIDITRRINKIIIEYINSFQRKLSSQLAYIISERCKENNKICNTKEDYIEVLKNSNLLRGNIDVFVERFKTGKLDSFWLKQYVDHIKMEGFETKGEFWRLPHYIYPTIFTFSSLIIFIEKLNEENQIKLFSVLIINNNIKIPPWLIRKIYKLFSRTRNQIAHNDSVVLINDEWLQDIFGKHSLNQVAKTIGVDYKNPVHIIISLLGLFIDSKSRPKGKIFFEIQKEIKQRIKDQKKSNLSFDKNNRFLKEWEKHLGI